MRARERQLTLVALYRERPAAFQTLIDNCVADIVDTCGALFEPYSREQFHATLIGLESVTVDGTRIQRNLLTDHHDTTPLRMDGFAEHLLRHFGCVDIRFGGFEPRETPFMSRDRSPFERSFSIQGNKAVLIGWPDTPGPPRQFPDTLDALRRTARTFGIAHAYHLNPGDFDNDLYLRLGAFSHRVRDDVRAAIEARLRDRIAHDGPIHVTLSVEQLRVVSYVDPELPPDTTVAYRLDDVDLSSPGIDVLLGPSEESG